MQRGPPASVIPHQGQTGARLERLERLRHVPREGSTRSTPPLRGLPIHTTRWGLDLSFNECYPSWTFRSRRTTAALSTSHCSLLTHAGKEQCYSGLKKNKTGVRCDRRMFHLTSKYAISFFSGGGVNKRKDYIFTKMLCLRDIKNRYERFFQAGRTHLKQASCNRPPVV